MGYYTRYSLEWKVLNEENTKPRCVHEKPENAKFCPTCGKQLDVPIGALISEYIENNSETFYGINWEGESVDSVKWYDHEYDLKSMSEYFSGVLFTLHGEGAESGDVWKKYFLDGKMQTAKAKITFDEFEQEKLK